MTYDAELKKVMSYIMEERGVFHAPIDKCDPWSENPEVRQTQNMSHLRTSLEKSGQIVPALVVPWKGRLIVLDANRRHFILNDLGVPTFAVSFPNMNGRLDAVYSGGKIKKFLAELWSEVKSNEARTPGVAFSEVITQHPSAEKWLSEPKRSDMRMIRRFIPNRQKRLEAAKEDATKISHMRIATMTKGVLQDLSEAKTRQLYEALVQRPGAAAELARRIQTKARISVAVKVRRIRKLVNSLLEGRPW